MNYNLKTHNWTWILAVIGVASFMICAGLFYVSDESKADTVNLNALDLYNNGSWTYPYIDGTEISISDGYYYHNDMEFFVKASPQSFTVSGGQTTTVVITQYQGDQPFGSPVTVYFVGTTNSATNLNALALYEAGSRTYAYDAGAEIYISDGSYYHNDMEFFVKASPQSFTVSGGQTTTVVITQYQGDQPFGSPVTVYFTGIVPTYTVTINVNDGTYGSVSTNTIQNVPQGSSITINGATITINGVTVTATPSSATADYVYVFNNWSNASGTITDNRTITANFLRQSVSPSLPADYSVTLSPGQSWSYTPGATPPSATLSIGGTATWLTLNNGTISGTAPNVTELTTYTLTITATTTNPVQTATQNVTFTVYPSMTASASTDTMYVYTGGPIPNTASETVTLTHSSFGTGTYTWSMVDNAGSGMTISEDGTLGGTCMLGPTASPITITVRCTGIVNGFTQTADVSFNLVVVAKLVFTTNPLTDGIIS